MWRLMSKGLMGTGAIRDGVEGDAMMGVETGSSEGAVCPSVCQWVHQDSEVTAKRLT